MASQEYYKFFNLKKLSDILKIQPDKLYNNFKALYFSLSPKECENIVSVLRPQCEKFFSRLGYSIRITKSKKRV